MRGGNVHYGSWSDEAKFCSQYSGNEVGRRMNNRISITILIFVVILFVTMIVFINSVDFSIISGSLYQKDILPVANTPVEIQCLEKCPEKNQTVNSNMIAPSSQACPEYFRWIHEDLKPWKETGITKKMVEKGKEVAHMRITIVKGRVYVAKYKTAFQTRDTITLWGILQLLRLYPGKLPDLDFMFECGDKPKVLKRDHHTDLPPVFHYCGDDSSLDIVFPEWSFWGWPEVNVKPWAELKQEIIDGNERKKWTDREPYAYWKGNTKVSPERKDLLKCNNGDWNAQIHQLNWANEKRAGFKDTNLASQCVHRYKIYVEGIAWSVSQKYILACDSVSLLIDPHYDDFYTRSLIPTVHYWPINRKQKCRSIKFAVDWGNNHIKKAQEIGKAGSKFVLDELETKYVYDYMFHLLLEYSKLMKYQPSIPKGSVEVCSESLICGKGLKKRFKLHTYVQYASDKGPCTLPPQYSPDDLQAFMERKENLKKKVETLERSGDIAAEL